MEDGRDRASSVSAELLRAGVLDVDSSSLARSLYSSDASLYRVPPALVVRPRDADEVLATLAACRSAGLPITARGAGTSIAGNAVGPGVVLDFSAYMNAVGPIDPDAATAVVQPGVVHAALQKAAKPSGLRFGPDPSSHSRCTIGGMIGNNACGSRALGYGRTSDNVLGLDVATAQGERVILGPGQATSPVLDRLRERVGTDLADIRLELGRFARQVSGYGLEHLLPERGFDVARALVGSEGTLAVVLGATVRLVRDPPHRALVVLGYPTIADAADDAPSMLVHRPAACEGLDSRIVDVLRATQGSDAVPDLPAGGAWLMVEVVGDTAEEAVSAAQRVRRDAGTTSARIVTRTADMRALWRIREDGAGLAARALARPGLAGWEDAAVPPARLGAYLRDFEALLVQHGLDGVPYGHFGDGCVHVRIDFPLETDPAGAVLRSFVHDAARLAASYGGSLSGEHGDGRARSELLPLMYPARVIDLFRDVKTIFDPDGLLNPGVLVRPRRVDSDLRLTVRSHVTNGLAMRLPADGGDLSAAVHRCTGVGKCLADNATGGGVMCPSYQATRNEKDSTRGRARVLQDMVAGAFDAGASPSWRAQEVTDALELCLACKGCASDCPTGVDMATYKAEVLHQRFRGRMRPRSHYTLGWLPRWTALAQHVPRLANLAFASPAVAHALRWSAGIDQRRALPRLARQSFRSWASGRPPADGDRAAVVLWVDTFTDHFTPTVGRGRRRPARTSRVPRRGPGRTAVLWADLDQHGPALPGQEHAAADSCGAREVRRRGCAGARARALVHRRAPSRRTGAPRRPTRPHARRERLHSRGAATAHPALEATGPRGRQRGRPAALPPRLDPRLGRRRGAAEKRRCTSAPRRWLLRSRGQLRHGEGSLRGVGRRRGTRPAPRGPDSGSGHHRRRRRLQLPYPARPAGRGGRGPPGRAAERCAIAPRRRSRPGTMTVPAHTRFDPAVPSR